MTLNESEEMRLYQKIRDEKSMYLFDKNESGLTIDEVILKIMTEQNVSDRKLAKNSYIYAQNKISTQSSTTIPEGSTLQA